MKSITKVKNLKGKRVLLRVDYNVPLKNGKVSDPFRIDASLPTINYLRKAGAKIILASHIGNDGKQSLKPVFNYLKKKIPNLKFSQIGVGHLSGDVVLLENLRKNPGEVENSKTFAKELASLADIYVNDAFSVSHRAHASIVGVPKLLPAYAGMQLEKEVKELSKAHNNIEHPFLFILGGAKFETKMPLIKRFLKDADTVFVGGALADNFLKVEGYEIGQSLFDKRAHGIAKLDKNKKIILPVDAIVQSNVGRLSEVGLDEVDAQDTIVDIGRITLAMLALYIKDAKMIVWNGPLGKGENIWGTREVLKLLAKSKATRIIGGGDTIEVLSALSIRNKVGFASTGGGAMIDFLSKGTLPGIKALEK
jgi:phosphoglycerate kinase